MIYVFGSTIYVLVPNRKMSKLVAIALDISLLGIVTNLKAYLTH